MVIPAIALLKSPDVSNFPETSILSQPSASSPEGPAEPHVFLIASLIIPELIQEVEKECIGNKWVKCAQ